MCRLHLFVLDSHLVTLWESNCPFGFPLVMFPLESSYFVFVFLSLWCLWWEVWDNCIGSWALPSLLFCRVIHYPLPLGVWEGLRFVIVALPGQFFLYIIFLISAQKHRLWVLVRTTSPRRSNEYPESMFWVEIRKMSEFLSENFHFFGGKIFSIFEEACFHNACLPRGVSGMTTHESQRKKMYLPKCEP